MFNSIFNIQLDNRKNTQNALLYHFFFQNNTSSYHFFQFRYYAKLLGNFMVTMY